MNLPSVLSHLVASYLDTVSYKTLIQLYPDIFTSETLYKKNLKQIPTIVLSPVLEAYDRALNLISIHFQNRKVDPSLVFYMLMDLEIKDLYDVESIVVSQIHKKINSVQDTIKHAANKGLAYCFCRCISDIREFDNLYVIRDCYFELLEQDLDVYEHTDIRRGPENAKLYKIFLQKYGKYLK